MAGVNADDLVVLVHTVLVDPVRVEYTEVTATTTDTLLRCAPQAALELDVVDTLADGFAIGSTLGDGLLPVATAHTHTVDDISLLGLVSQTTSFVGSGGT